MSGVSFISFHFMESIFFLHPGDIQWQCKIIISKPNECTYISQLAQFLTNLEKNSFIILNAIRDVLKNLKT